MFKVNEYFGGNVKSLAFETSECPATIGVMKMGEYEFGTNCIEHMTIVSGKMSVKLPGQNDWKNYNQFETFVVEKDTKFMVKVDADTAYLCKYK